MTAGPCDRCGGTAILHLVEVGPALSRKRRRRRVTLCEVCRDQHWTKCERKRRYNRQTGALRDAAALSGASAYGCWYCGGWHVGRRSQRSEHR